MQVLGLELEPTGDACISGNGFISGTTYCGVFVHVHIELESNDLASISPQPLSFVHDYCFLNPFLCFETCDALLVTILSLS